MSIYEEMESNARSYCRKFPVEFAKAKNDVLIDSAGNEYIDFFAGAGAINFGHNNPYIKQKVLEYLEEDSIIHALDMHTVAKTAYLNKLRDRILSPRGYDYKIMFCGSTGTNAVEAALKLARKNTGRKRVLSCSGAFHGMSLGSLALTSDRFSRQGAGTNLNDVTFIPYDDNNVYSCQFLKNVLEDDHSGVDRPAALFLETVQAEGGINVASIEWLKRVSDLCKKNDVLLVVDDIQVGVGRCGTWFSFERAGIEPDIVCMSKSISGFGSPMSVIFMRPELDIFAPAEHNGTFRGFQISFVGATAAIDYYNDNKLGEKVAEDGTFTRSFLKDTVEQLGLTAEIRGLGMINGLDLSAYGEEAAARVAQRCFDNGLVIERAGRNDTVLKLIPPLTITRDHLTEGLSIIKSSVKEELL